jgi:uncharacterized protein involved in response to NO
MSLISIEEPPTVSNPSASLWLHPVLRLGFRPLYLLAALFAALAVPLWTAQVAGHLHGWAQLGVAWHMHEMVFGFAIAVVVGFLYTAGRTWTGLWTPREGQLAMLAALWLAGRAAMFALPPLPAALVDALFLPCAAWPMYSVLKQSGNTRNLFLVGLLGLLALCNAAFHGAVLGWLKLAPAAPVQAAILIIVVIESVIGGRVIPMFTRNGAPGSTPQVRPALDKFALGALACASLAWVAGLPAVLTAPLCLVAGAAALVRLAGWQPRATLRVPLLWILHLSYGWIGVGFILLAGASAGLLPASAALHALTVGSMAGLIIGMMTRTSLGHTGRPLKAGRAEVAMYLLIQLGGLARLAAGVGPHGWYLAALVLASLCWSLSFALFAWTYGPYLWRPRVDGKEG